VRGLPGPPYSFAITRVIVASSVPAGMRGLEPKDQAEIMLASQMAVTHMAVMSEASLLRNANGHKSRDLHERTFNKLARTFTAQMAALKNHRSPHGQQKMVVEHVNVHEGGQAIVGPVERERGPA
jgi:hypothetical protein